MHPDVLSAGIIVADHVCTPIDHLPLAGELVMADGMLLTIGGCAANAAVDLVKMNVKTAIVGRVGKDIFGRIVTDLLKDAGVDVQGIKVSDQADTSQTLIVNVQGQDRRFIHTFGANADFRPADVDETLLAQCKILYLGGYLAMPGVRKEELTALFRSAREKGTRTVLDVVVPRADANYVEQFAQLLPHVDVFLPNHQEGELIAGIKDPLAQAEFFHRLGAGTVVITMGGEGSVLVTGDRKLRAGTFSVPYVDASGGGDAFDAGYIYGMLHRLEPEECLQVASALGASCVRAIGTTPGVFTRRECEEFLRANRLEIRRV